MANQTRIPPHNIEAEQAVLGALMLDKEAIFQIVDFVFADDFYQPKHGIIYEAMRDLFTRNEPLDLLAVVNRLKEKKVLTEIGGRDYLAELIDTTPSSSSVTYYGQIIKKKRLLRDLISASAHIGDLGYDEEREAEDILDEAEKRIFRITQRSVRQSFVELKSALGEAFARIDQLSKGGGGMRGVPTGFKVLDNILSGLQKSDLIILAARPSVGKTTLAMDIARNAALIHGVPVGIFSLEMSTDQLVDRMLASQSEVSLWKLRTGKGLHNDDFTKVQRALGELSKAPIYIDETSSTSVNQIRAMSRRLQSEKGLGLIIVDYIQLLESRAENRVQQVSEISRALKGLARELNIPVLVLSQLSRAIEHRGSDAKPKLSDLRESGCLAGDTPIMRADTGELIPIQELVGQKNIPIFSLNEEHKLEMKTISRVFSSGRKKLFELTTRSGRTIKASANHPFLTIEGWQRLDSLTVETHIALPRALRHQKNSQPLRDEEIILLAHLIGDGCVLPRQPIHYTSADKENLDTVSDAARILFNIKPRIVKQKNWFHVYLPSPYRLTHGKYHPITLWFNALGLKRVRSYEKMLPKALFVSSEKKIRLFLHHLWATDGNISWKTHPLRKTRGGAIYYSTSSKQLAIQVQHLLLRLGIMSTLRPVPQKSHRLNYHVHVQGSNNQIQFCKLIGSHGSRGEIVNDLLHELKRITPNPNTDAIPREVWQSRILPEKLLANISWRTFADRIDTAYCGSTFFKQGVSRARMTRIATALESKTLLTLAQSDIYWDEIISITPLDVKEVFDATVPDTHNFVANDFIVHNSIEQDADVVLFIHRDDKANANSKRKNIADILISKHRNGPTGERSLYFDSNAVRFIELAEEYKDLAIDQGDTFFETLEESGS